MKKNMLAVLILIISVINLTLLAFIVFSVVPGAQKTNELVTKILAVIDIELENPLPSDNDSENKGYDITKIEKYEFEDMSTNIRPGEDNKNHGVMISASLTIDTEHDDYKKLNEKVDTMKSDMRAIIINKVKGYTAAELNDPAVTDTIKTEILAEIQSLFGSTFIVDCTMTFLVQ